MHARAVLASWAAGSSVHGLRHVVQEDTPRLERLFWLVLLLLCTTSTINFGYSKYMEYLNSPTETIVLTDAMGLDKIGFPAVLLCPTDKVVVNKALRWLRSALGEATASMVNATVTPSDGDLESLLKGLSWLTHQHLEDAAEQLEKLESWLPLLDEFSVTELMLEVFPACDAVFHSCLWRGKPVDCCSIFRLVATDRGLCYVFNSFRARKKTPGRVDVHDCLRTEEGLNAMLMQQFIPEEAEPGSQDQDPNCTVYRAYGTGPGTGLRFYLNSNLLAGVDPKITNRLAWVSLSSSVEWPDPSHAVPVINIPGSATEVRVSTSYTVSSRSVRELPLSARRCMLPREVPDGDFYRWYTQRACYLSCRLRYMRSRCNCVPYPFSTLLHAPDLAECSMSELAPCARKLHGRLSFFTPWPVTPGFTPKERRRSIPCTDCFPECFYARYKAHSEQPSRGSGLPRVMVDVSYESLDNGVMYLRRQTITRNQLLVALGGIANFFLGMSYASVLEFAVVTVKLVLVVVARSCRYQ